MQTGKETWKWGAVALLLAIFLITANQAYKHIASQEEFAPPDDWQNGDSWDLENHKGPGASQPIEVMTNTNTNIAPKATSTQVNQRLSIPEPILLEDDSQWDQSVEEKSEPAEKVAEPIVESASEPAEIPNKAEVKANPIESNDDFFVTEPTK